MTLNQNTTQPVSYKNNTNGYEYNNLHGIKFIGIIFRLLSMILPFVGLAIRFRFCQWTGRAFNKSNGFIIGMFILPIVFDTMLGFNADEYVDNMFLESDDEF